MFKSEDIHSISDFVRNHKRHDAHLRETGRPGVLTINGSAALVLQDVRSLVDADVLLIGRPGRQV